MKKIIRLIFCIIVGLGLFAALMVNVANAGLGDGDDTNYVDNGNFESGSSFWTLTGSNIAVETCDSPNDCLDLVNGQARQVQFLPAGTLHVEFRYWVYAGGGVTFRILDDTLTEVDTVSFAATGGWRNAADNMNIPTSGNYTLEFNHDFNGSWVDDVVVTVDGSGPTIPTVITTTVPITSTCLISFGGISQTVGANLLENPSFENNVDNLYIPDGWTINNPIYAPDMYKKDNSGNAYEGDDYLSSQPYAELSIYQSVYDLPESNYLYGAHFNYDNSGPFSFAAEMSLGSDNTPAAALTGTTGYDSYEGTTTSTSGTQDFTISFPSQTTGTIYADWAYVIPITSTITGTQVYCGAVEEFYNSPTGGGGVPTYTANYPFPEGGAAPIICRDCPRPNGVSWNIVGEWIGYLSCILVNLFTCSLRIWFLNLIQHLKPLYGFFIAAFNWLAANWQLVLNWTGGQISSIILWAWNLVSSGWGIIGPWLSENGTAVLEAIINALFYIPITIANLLGFTALGGYILELGVLAVQAILAIVQDVYEGLLSFIDILQIVFRGIRGSFTEDPFEIVLVTQEGGEVGTIPPDSLYASGPNVVKVLWLSLAALASLDYVLEVTPVELIIIPIIGGMAFGVILWTGRLWENGLPI